MFRLFAQCIGVFGIRGLAVYLQLKLGLTDNIRIPGIRSTLHMRASMADKSSFREIFMKREYDVELEFPVRNIIDAGANIGFTTLFFANKYPDAKIISIEPDAANFNMLKKNTGTYPRISVLQAALWMQSERVAIVDRSLGERGLMIGRQSAGEQIEGISIGNLIQRYGLEKIDILKVDIEGSEKEVFSGDTEWLNRTRCLIIELHDRMKPGCSQAVFHALLKHDFLMSVRGENLVFVNNRKN